MNETILKCSDERRRQMVRDQANSYDGLNGIDYVEVIEDTDQKQLCVHFFGDVPDNLVPKNVRIECGERIRDIKVLSVEPHRSNDPLHEDCLRVEVDKAGDFSCYKLCLYELEEDGDTSDIPLKSFDPRYVCATFSFKIDCPSTVDCKDANLCPPEAREEPEINYLAKDYASFRQLILDRLALLIPDWRERHVPDIGIALVEVLAYVGDYLSYYQDAVATEAYLDTARLRISVRRHARLVDYFMHEGCNARAWVCLEADRKYQELDANEFYFITGNKKLDDLGSNVISRERLDELNISPGGYEVFEPLVEDKAKKIPIYQAHNEIKFYTWGDDECCLQRGATRATLLDEWVRVETTPKKQTQEQQQQTEQYNVEESETKHERSLNLKVGDVLIFEEVVGAKTGDAADADPKRRCAVRLVRVDPGEDPLTKEPIVEIAWSEADALPFDLCLSARLASPDCRVKKNVSVARGNVILVDHGETVWEKIDGIVPTIETPGECLCEGSVVEFTDVAGKFLCTLKQLPVTFSQAVSRTSPASKQLRQDARKALPNVTLSGEPSDVDEESTPFFDELKTVWHPKFDLLASDSDERSFVVEIDNDGRAHIRFGDGECGRMPEAGTSFSARYRVGNGRRGNVGAETIKYMVTQFLVSGSKIRTRNPMPAVGGIEAEPIAEVKLFAPGAFRKKLERAITAEDYAQLAELNEKWLRGEIEERVQRAAANLRWTGSWHEARVALDPFGAEALSDELGRATKGSLYRYRRIGHDLSVAGARYVPLDIAFEICVAPEYLRGHVEAALREAFGQGVAANGRRGFFHPDNLTFGGGIYLSALVAAAQAVEGVVSARVVRLQRLFESANDEIANGVLPLAKNEIARLDTNPNFPERGRLEFDLTGGR
jgi:hypothetical protein